MAVEPSADPMERLWVEQAQRGDLAAFNAIVERCQKHAYNLAFRMLRDSAAAEDATQEAFFSAFRSITRFRGGNLRSWLLTILANGCRDYLRSPQRRRTTSLDAIVAEGDPGGRWASPDPSPEEQVLQDELSGQVHAALQRLPDDHRLVVTLVDLQGLDYEEASRIIGVSLGTVKSRLSRGRDRLRQILRPVLELSTGPSRQEG